MGKAEILDAIARLSEEERAEVRARLDQLAARSLPTPAVPPRLQEPRSHAARIRTPRLANRSQLGDFKKTVTDLPAHA